MAGVHDSIGIDLVAMNVNDLLTCGAEPLCFLDYLAVGRLASVPVEAIIRGIVRGCKIAQVSLVGGETAEMPGLYDPGEYDLAGFAAGIVEESELLTGAKIRPGDLLIGLTSHGIHSNGYSLVRAALGITSGARLARLERSWPELSVDTLLRPTAVYVRPVLSAIKRGFPIVGMAHITGGGIAGNLVRILPRQTRAIIDRSALPSLPVFETIRRVGRISQPEMDRTFNCGVGFILVIRRRQAEPVLEFMQSNGTAATVIGRIDRGARAVHYQPLR
jgi:phosphoribosylformylglycinamidine cyclo-ligase